MKKYEGDILFGTFLTLLGVCVLYSLGWNLILGWGVILIGKAMIILGATEYSDKRRAIRGYDLSKDSKLRKKFRKLRRKRY